ncbi:MAG: anaerobic ribonucleoside-triphosphate reductase activating protein [Clostridia bacterium]|nr:anaerobic ribonucleoside-triphosphate reductase activating protein [Clostridia bacterium]MDQ7792437.1 anaerobic ribonucleoside-triphosphate reductase activating protein [Clostridia bacterium]
MVEGFAIGGFTKLSLVDWFSKVVSVVFVRGCNFRCPWCQNPDLVDPGRFSELVPPKNVLAYLARRRDLLDGVVVTGGEALLAPELFAFLEAIKHTGLPVKLDTNGSNPDKLLHLFESGLVDHVAVDYKLPFRLYPKVVGGLCPDAVRRSIVTVLERECGEIRTTVVPGMHTREVLAEMLAEIPGLQAGNYRLQAFRPGNCLNLEFNERVAIEKAYLAELAQNLGLLER